MASLPKPGEPFQLRVSKTNEKDLHAALHLPFWFLLKVPKSLCLSSQLSVCMCHLLRAGHKLGQQLDPLSDIDKNILLQHLIMRLAADAVSIVFC